MDNGRWARLILIWATTPLYQTFIFESGAQGFLCIFFYNVAVADDDASEVPLQDLPY